MEPTALKPSIFPWATLGGDLHIGCHAQVWGIALLLMYRWGYDGHLPITAIFGWFPILRISTLTAFFIFLLFRQHVNL